MYREIKRTIPTIFTIAMVKLLYVVVVSDTVITESTSLDELIPSFAASVENISVPAGRDAQLSCVVDNLGTYRAAWIKVESKAILTIHNRVISRNYRISLSHSDDRHFVLQIRSVQETDRGGYMCQLNTVPMKSQVGYLDVLIAPDIIVSESSSDVVTREGSNVSMTCKAKGYPAPNITWRREDNEPIPLGTSQGKKILATAFEGEQLTIVRVSRLHMGAYLCIASNGVPPSVSRRILLYVQFPPVMWVPNAVVGASQGSDVVLDCHSEAYPVSINYWTKEGSEDVLLSNSSKYEVYVREKKYKNQMKLTLKKLDKRDFGIYKCFAKNSLGTSEHSVQLFEIIPATQPTTTSTTTTTTVQPITRTRSNKESSSYQRIQRFESMREGSRKEIEDVTVRHKEENVLPTKSHVIKGSRNTSIVYYRPSRNSASARLTTPVFNFAICLIFTWTFTNLSRNFRSK